MLCTVDLQSSMVDADDVTCHVFQFRIFTAPFHVVGFADFWLADQLNSLSCVLLDLEFLICYYAVEVDWLGDDSKWVTISLCYTSSPNTWTRLVKVTSHDVQ